MEKTETENKRSKMRIWPVIVFIIMAIAIGIWGYFQGEAEGVIRKGEVKENAPAAANEKIRFNGKYLSFAHSSRYKPSALNENKEGNGGEKNGKSSFLESIFLVAYSSISSKKLAVSVEALPSGNLEDNSSYKMRISKPDVYTKSTLEMQNKTLDLFTNDTETKEQGVFLYHDGIIVSVVLSSTNDSLENMKEEIAAIVKSIEWKEVY